MQKDFPAESQEGRLTCSGTCSTCPFAPSGQGRPQQGGFPQLSPAFGLHPLPALRKLGTAPIPEALPIGCVLWDVLGKPANQRGQSNAVQSRGIFFFLVATLIS